VRRETGTVAQDTASPAARVRALAEHVRDQVRYVAIEVGEGRWEPHRATDILQNRYGDCKDKVTLLRAMLRSAGIASFLVLVNTREDVDSAAPSPFQFNHAILAIPLEAIGDSSAWRQASAGGYVFFDPTDETTPFGSLPVQEQGSGVLVVAPGTTELLWLPYGNPASDRRRSEMQVTIASGGAMNGTVRFAAHGRFAHRLRHLFKTTPGADQVSYVRAWFPSSLGEVTLSDLHADGAADSFAVSLAFTAARGAVASGTMRIVTTNVFREQEYPALTAATRTHPIWFGGPATVENDVTIRVPEGWTTDGSLPAKTSSCLDAARLSYDLTRSGQEFRLRSTSTTEGRVVPVSEYRSAKTFNKDVRAYYNLTILFQVP
jgi:hypothetical protein